MDRLLKILKIVAIALARMLVMMLVTATGVVGIMVLQYRDPLGWVMLGVVVVGEIGLWRCGKTWKKVFGAVVLVFLCSVLLYIDGTRRRKDDLQVIHEDNVRNYLKGYEIRTLVFSPPSTLQDAIDYFKTEDKSAGDPAHPLEVVVEAKDETCRKRPLPAVTAQNVSFYDAIKLVADRAGFDMEIHDRQVVLRER